MFEEILEEGKDFFEDLFEHLTEKKPGKEKDLLTARERTRFAYLFSERIDSFMKMLFGTSIIVSALIASVWGIPAVGDMVRMFVTNIIGRLILIVIGISYIINGLWRQFYVMKESKTSRTQTD